YRAVLEVLEEGASVTEVARRHGVARQTVHEWLGGWGLWRTGRRGRGRARIRCPRWWRRGSPGCGGIIRGGGRRGSGGSWSALGGGRCPGGRRGNGGWFAPASAVP